MGAGKSALRPGLSGRLRSRRGRSRPFGRAGVRRCGDFATGATLPYLNDSKKVTPRRREILFDQIREQAIAYAIAWADEKEIDAINILNARMLAMDRAIKMLNPAADFALIDGNRNQGIELQNEMVVHGDARSASIAAASILAKVSRDRFMVELAEQYPQYAFEKHKGYPTKLHYQLLRQYGPSPVHRKTFLKKL